MGFAVWVDEQEQVAWAQGTHEYRPMGAAVIAIRDQFRQRDFRQALKPPSCVNPLFAGFFGSLETVNHYLAAAYLTPAASGASAKEKRRFRPTPAYLL